MKVNIVVGSKSSLKLDAVKAACEEVSIDADVIGVSTSSGVPEQPVGYEEILSGALNRSHEALANAGDAWTVGIENGLVRVGEERYVDIAAVVIRIPGEAALISTSEAVEFPWDEVSMALASVGRSKTAGSFIADRYNCSEDDPHSYLTRGLTSRSEILEAVLTASFKKALKRNR